MAGCRFCGGGTGNDPSAIRLPILNYHGVEARSGEYNWQGGESTYVLRLEDFELHMKYLAKNGFHSVNSTEMGAYLDGSLKLLNPIMLTFDDGHRSHYDHVRDCLLRNRLKAVFFITPGLVGQGNLMNWTQITEMAHQGFEIGSHGLTHVPLTSLTHEDMIRELKESKEILESKLGRTVSCFSVPLGFHRQKISELAAKIGYQFVFTSDFDINRSGRNIFMLKRLAIRPATSFEEFTRLARGHLGWRHGLTENVKTSLRRLMPPAAYQALAAVKYRFARWKDGLS